MYICLMYSSELIKGTLKTIILNLLKEQGKMYGYEIVQKVKELTDSKIQLTEGALYPTLHSLQKSGELDIEKQYMGKRVRKYYTCLLYTSPSPRDQRGSRMPSSA